MINILDKNKLVKAFSQVTPYIKQGLLASLLVGSSISMVNVNSARAADLLNEHAGAIKPVTSTQNLPNFVNLVKQVRPAVVSITSKMTAGGEDQMISGFPDGGNFPGGSGGFSSPFPFPMFPQQMPKQIIEARGSGFIISPDGYVVTNNHVVKGAKIITVSLEDGSKYQAKIIGLDPKTDLALLKIKSDKPFSFIQLGDSNGVEAGEWVVAVGDPYGLGGTVTAGIVSARGRDIGDGPYDSFIQIDAPINRGNSGGPLFSQDGKVIGVNTAILSPSGGSIGIGFAIPSNTVKSIIGQLEKNGHVTRGYIGVAAQSVTSSMIKALKLPAVDHDKAPQGALIASISPDSPAEKGGLNVGDVVLSLDGKDVKDPRELAVRVASIIPGTTIKLVVLRDGVKKDITIKVANLNDDKQDNKEIVKKPSNIGVALSPLTPDIRQQIGVEETVKGVVISGIKSNSPADRAGLQTGDVIVSVDNHPVDNPSAATDTIASVLKKDTNVLLRIVRGGQSLFVPVTSGDNN
ncbi:Do family serine endopeptidase [Commensalibacter papalotli (ex Botero et al. 2024)]|uniref:Probable periplasmic serine endoprotease DegP-like n=1 Tax=Commensalibacter papalotli (ex Botero et al. 2024) TaxID=2972766 RepID=A0ABN8WE80_9PROT|nr:Do family serine endopeptidase [Commensalibacter papalotli (ex Botero et al. 2024)]CAI3942959.1 Periplasmic serine protease [Commensalibacter papalotli (ex Botero et al. 2024)]CAI3947972.1 Periplasmic serine protease [Commensalibacter papalotli (ex Botero et al. 2024)]